MAEAAGREAFRRAAAPVVLLCLSAVTAGCGEEAVEAPAVARPVKMLTIGGQESGGTREYPGDIRPAQNAEMAFEVPGKIVEFVFKEGERVEEGEVLAKLDPRDYQARLDSERAKYGNAKVDLDRAEVLYTEGVLAKSKYDNRKAQFGIYEAALREARKALEDTALRAPFAGRMARKLVQDFQNVQAKELVLVLQDDSSLEIKVAVPERDLAGGTGRRTPEEITARIRPEVVVSSLPDRRFPARLKELATTADTTTRTFEATFAFDNPADVNVLPGMTAKVVIRLPRDAAGRGVLIPASAALEDEGGAPYVWIVDPDSMTVRRAPVELGQLSGSQVVVPSGLSAGDVIVVSGVHQLREGMPVRSFER